MEYVFEVTQVRTTSPSCIHPADTVAATLSSQTYSTQSRRMILARCCASLIAAMPGSLKQFTTPRDVNFCLIACTTASTRARFEGGIELPIGVFTRALLDGLITATESATSDLITADSLFKFARAQTVRQTSGLQQPYVTGKLDEEISKYSAKPVIVTGISTAPEASAYHKLLAIATVIGNRTFTDLRDLYGLLPTVTAMHSSPPTNGKTGVL